MYTSTLVKEPRPVWMPWPSELHNVQNLNFLHKLSLSAPILTLKDEFLSMNTPPKFCKPWFTRLSGLRQSGVMVLLCRQLEGYHSKSLGLECGEGRVPDIMGIKSLSTGASFSEQYGGHGGTGDGPQGCDNRGVTNARSVREHHFPGRQKDGGMRPVINLKILNHLVEYNHFQMEGLGSLLNSLVVNDFQTKMDLKDAYFTLQIHQRHQKYFHFRWRGKLYQFLVLPFSLSSAPRVFTDEGADELLEMPDIQKCLVLQRHLSG